MPWGWARHTAAYDLDVELVVVGRRHVRELLVGVGPLVDDAEVELLHEEALLYLEVGNAHGLVVAAHRGEESSRGRGREGSGGLG